MVKADQNLMLDGSILQSNREAIFNRRNDNNESEAFSVAQEARRGENNNCK